MGVTLERVQNKFACIIGELCSEPVVLSKFAIWLDLRLAEYKSKGAISLDCSGESPDPTWLKGHEKPLTHPNDNHTVQQQHFYEDQSVLERLSPDILASDETVTAVPTSLYKSGKAIQKRKRPSTEIYTVEENESSPSKIHRRFESSSADQEYNESLMSIIGEERLSEEANKKIQQAQFTNWKSPPLKGDNSMTYLSENQEELCDISQPGNSTADDSMLNISQDFKLNHSHHLGPCKSSGGRSYLEDSQWVQHYQLKSGVIRNPGFYRRRAKFRIPGRHLKTCNTLGHLAGAVGCLEFWLHKAHDEKRFVETLPPDELNTYLVSFFKNGKRSSGKDFDVGTLSTFRSYVERFLKENNYPESISTSDYFLDTRNAAIARRKQLKVVEMETVTANSNDEVSTCVPSDV